MPREVIVLRTNHYDAATDVFIRGIMKTSGRRVVIAADEHAGPVQTPLDIRKITINPDFLGLFSHPNFGWRCGDYSLYAALTAMPDVDFFWLIEPDVRINATNTKAFFDGSGYNTDADFVTPWFVASSKEWFWYDRIAIYYPNVYNCMLQLCRFSRTGATKLREARSALSQHYLANGIDADLWPNDESFVGAVAKSQDFSIETFSGHAPTFTTDKTFTFTQPFSERWLKAKGPDNAIYHPVVSGTKFHERRSQFLKDLSHLSEFDRVAVMAALEAQAAYEPDY